MNHATRMYVGLTLCAALAVIASVILRCLP